MQPVSFFWRAFVECDGASWILTNPNAFRHAENFSILSAAQRLGALYFQRLGAPGFSDTTDKSASIGACTVHAPSALKRRDGLGVKLESALE
jgi:hypothetical protein